MGMAVSQELEIELRKIADFILALRREIGALQANDLHQSRIPRAGEELAAVVSSTEGATNEILAIAEGVIAADIGDPDAYKNFVRNEMTALFETCAFQDLTGQRISRVVKTLEHIEARVARFANYTRIQDLTGYANDQEEAAASRMARYLLNGPGAKGEGNSQARIDEMFASANPANG